MLLSDLKTDGQGKSRSLYSLRHTAIMLRLLNAENLDSLTLARTSVEMIDRFYAKPLTSEMNVDLLHSQRRPRKVAAPQVDTEGEEIPRKASKKAKNTVQQV